MTMWAIVLVGIAVFFLLDWAQTRREVYVRRIVKEELEQFKKETVINNTVTLESSVPPPPPPDRVIKKDGA